MMIDCDSCTVRGAACTDCVVTFLTIPVRPSVARPPAADAGRSRANSRGDGWVPAHGWVPDDRSAPGGAGSAAVPPGAPPSAAPPGTTVDLDDDERAAIDVLASSGLVPPLRMVRAV